MNKKKIVLYACIFLIVLVSVQAVSLSTGSEAFRIVVEEEVDEAQFIKDTINNSGFYNITVANATISFVNDSYVPYTGAVNNVDLGVNNLTTSGIYQCEGNIGLYQEGSDFVGNGLEWDVFFLEGTATLGTDAWLKFDGNQGRYEFGLDAGDAMTITTAGQVITGSGLTTNGAIIANSGSITSAAGAVVASVGNLAGGGGTLTLGTNSLASNPQISFLTDGNDGGFIWDRTNDYFTFNDGINMNSNEPIFFRGLSSMFISGTADTVLRMESPQAIQMDAFQFTFGPGGAADTWMFFDATNTGRFDWKNVEDWFEYYDDINLQDGERLYFGGTGSIYLNSSLDTFVISNNTNVSGDVNATNFNGTTATFTDLNLTGNMWGLEDSDYNLTGDMTLSDQEPVNTGLGQLVLEDTGGGQRGLAIIQARNAVATPLFRTYKSRNTVASPTTINSGDFIGGWFGYAYLDDDYYAKVAMGMIVEDVDGPSQGGNGSFVWSTENGSNVIASVTSSEKMRLDGHGNLGIGTATPTQTLTVVGDGNVTRNFTGNFLYGSMWFHNESSSGAETVINSAGVWENVTGFNQTVDVGQKLNGFTFVNSNALVPAIPGEYEVDYSMSFERVSGGVGREYRVAIAVNEIIMNETESHRFISNANDVGNTGGTGIINLTTGDIITLQVMNEGGTENAGVHAASVKFVRVGDII